MTSDSETAENLDSLPRVDSFGEFIRREYRRALAAGRFEMRRSFTTSRISLWLMLVLFPSVIMGIFRYNNAEIPEQGWGVALYLLAAQATPMLGLLLWVAPAIQMELEGNTWSYVATRPGGKFAILMGKYINGVLWSIATGTTGLILAMLVAWPPVQSRAQLLGILVILQCLGSFAYGSLYLMIGVIIPKRSMVIAVAYTLTFEVVVSLVPATINQLTVQHRLWNLLWTWNSHWTPAPPIELTLDNQSPATQLLVLAGYTLALLSISCVVVRRSAYLHASTEA